MSLKLLTLLISLELGYSQIVGKGKLDDEIHIYVSAISLVMVQLLTAFIYFAVSL